jgi:hypothetical protein
MRTKKAMKKVAIKGPIKDLSINLSNFLITSADRFVSLNMTDAKIWLSEEELALVSRTDWILTKHRVIQKVYDVLGATQSAAARELGESFIIGGQPSASPKISRGENYQGLPYVILDYPALFHKTGIMAVRTLFWWGNFFSVTLHLSGCYWEAHRPLLQSGLSFFQQHTLSICIGEDQWAHHFDRDYFIPSGELPERDYMALVEQKPFFKAGKTYDLRGDWHQLSAQLSNAIIVLAKVLTINSPGGEKDL